MGCSDGTTARLDASSAEEGTAGTSTSTSTSGRAQDVIAPAQRESAGRGGCRLLPAGRGIRDAGLV